MPSRTGSAPKGEGDSGGTESRRRRYVTAIGPAQLLVLGLRQADFHGEVIKKLRESDTGRVIARTVSRSHTARHLELLHAGLAHAGLAGAADPMRRSRARRRQWRGPRRVVDTGLI
jgi:hypothetical protein